MTTTLSTGRSVPGTNRNETLLVATKRETPAAKRRMVGRSRGRQAQLDDAANVRRRTLKIDTETAVSEYVMRQLRKAVVK